MGVRLFKKLLLSLVDTASKNLDQTTLAQITLAQLMGKAATVRNTQMTTKRSLGTSFNESRAADIHTNQAGSSQ